MSTSENTEKSEELQVFVLGSGYKYQFSRGLLAHDLEDHGIPLDLAYKIAKRVYRILKKGEYTEIHENVLRHIVKHVVLDRSGEEIANHYEIVERWHESNIPLVILISAAIGVGTAIVGEQISKKLNIQNIVSTDLVTHVLRRMINPTLSPELHNKSYRAYKTLRPMYSVLYDKVLIGFEEHARFPAEGVEALVKRAINEGQNMIIRGEHLVPRFLSEPLISHPSIIYVTLNVSDEEVHRKRYLSRYDESRHEKRNIYFGSIRKIHDYLVEEARNRQYTVIEATDLNSAIEELDKIVKDRLETMLPSLESDGIDIKAFDDALINS